VIGNSLDWTHPISQTERLFWALLWFPNAGQDFAGFERCWKVAYGLLMMLKILCRIYKDTIVFSGISTVCNDAKTNI
jgi:hypothetical protein